MKQKEFETFLGLILNVGKLMIQSGCEIWRVEDSLSRILKAYEFPKIEVYASSTLILVTVSANEDINATQSVRVGQVLNNLSALEDINTLSRYICENTPPIDVITEKISEVLSPRQAHHYTSIGYIVVSASFAIFFGGSMLDGLVAGIIGFIIFLIEKHFHIRNINKLLYILIMNILTSSMAILATRLGFGNNADKIIIGTVMLFIPGLALVNGVKDMFNRDINSGVFRVVEAILIASAISLGVGLSIVLWGGI